MEQREHEGERGVLRHHGQLSRRGNDLLCAEVLLRALNRVFTLIFEVPVADRAQLRRAQSRLHFGSSLCAFGHRDRGKLADKVGAARTLIDCRNADR